MTLPMAPPLWDRVVAWRWPGTARSFPVWLFGGLFGGGLEGVWGFVWGWFRGGLLVALLWWFGVVCVRGLRARFACAPALRPAGLFFSAETKWV
jgi:hypothetical protein